MACGKLAIRTEETRPEVPLVGRLRESRALESTAPKPRELMVFPVPVMTAPTAWLRR